jgi:hypothetical protein
MREFRNRAREFFQGGELVFITHYGRLSGLLVPLGDTGKLPGKLKRKILEHLGKTISQRLRRRGVSEKQVLQDLETWRKRRNERRGRS